jgi:hypothetical protein
MKIMGIQEKTQLTTHEMQTAIHAASTAGSFMNADSDQSESPPL